MADDLTRAIAATGLAGSSMNFPAAALDDARWTRLVAQIRFHKLQGMLASAVTSGALPTTSAQSEHVLTSHAAAMELCLLLDADLLHVAEIFEEGRIEMRVLKGASFAHLDYPDPALRVYGDIDVLVRSEQYQAAVHLLVDRGYHRHFEEVRAGFDDRFGKGANFTAAAGGRSVDLHRTFVMGPFGLAIPLEDLWRGEERFEMAGRPLVALDREARFLHACFHAAIGNARTRLSPLRDVAGMLQRDSCPVDLERVRALSARWQADPVLARAISLTWQAFGLTESEISHWANGYRGGPAGDRALRSYLDPSMGYAARCYAALQMVTGAREKLAFARALAFPDRQYLASRPGGRVARWGNAARQITRLYIRGRGKA